MIHLTLLSDWSSPILLFLKRMATSKECWELSSAMSRKPQGHHQEEEGKQRGSDGDGEEQEAGLFGWRSIVNLMLRNLQHLKLVMAAKKTVSLFIFSIIFPQSVFSLMHNTGTFYLPFVPLTNWNVHLLCRNSG